MVLNLKGKMQINELERVIIGIIHNPKGMAPEFMWHMVSFARHISELGISPIFVPYARENTEESFQKILDHLKQNPFNYAIFLQDYVYPPIYAFRYFKDWHKWNNGIRPMPLSGWTFDRSDSVRSQFSQKLDYFSEWEGRSVCPPEFMVCTAEHVRKTGYNIEGFRERSITYDGRLACDSYVDGKFFPSAKRVNKHIFGVEDPHFQFGGFRFLHQIVDPEKLAVSEEAMNGCQQVIASEKELRG